MSDDFGDISDHELEQELARRRAKQDLASHKSRIEHNSIVAEHAEHLIPFVDPTDKTTVGILQGLVQAREFSTLSDLAYFEINVSISARWTREEE